MQRLEKTELRKADRTVGVTVYNFLLKQADAGKHVQRFINTSTLCKQHAGVQTPYFPPFDIFGAFLVLSLGLYKGKRVYKLV